MTRFIETWLVDVRMTFMSVRIPLCLDCFVDMPMDALFSIAQPIAKKACDLDLLPACLLSTNLHVLMPVML